jgi:L-threonylcarbamoyladenylate synthase
LTTRLIETSAITPDEEALRRAAEAIKRGEVVAIPSDTLYVLVADPFSLKAVMSVFQAKGREPHRALPVFVTGIEMAEDYTANLSSNFYLLARRFWPGPLTMIVPSSAKMPLKVTGNTGRLALRQPNAAFPTALLNAVGSPLIATSANVSGSPTCTSGFEVLGTMDGRVDLIVEGGTISGVGSTTIDITDPEWRVIRAGAVSDSDLADCLR